MIKTYIDLILILVLGALIPMGDKSLTVWLALTVQSLVDFLKAEFIRIYDNNPWYSMLLCIVIIVICSIPLYINYRKTKKKKESEVKEVE
jgi:uncharacterized membrane protein affecting hemolysin expression